MTLRLARPAVLVAAALAYAAALLAVSSGMLPAAADPSGASVAPGASVVPGAAEASAPAAAPVTGDARYYRSSVVAVEPAAPGLDVTVAAGGAVTLTNGTGREVVVLGYAGEPYLRFTDSGMVLRNSASLTTALVAGRTPGRTTAADGSPLVTWEHVSHEPRFTWTDVRARWSADERPPVVARDEHARHRVFDWALDVTVGDQPTLVRGAVDWIGVPVARAEDPTTWAVGAAAGTVTVGVLALALLRRRRGRRRAQAEAEAAALRSEAAATAAATAATGHASVGAPALVLSGRPAAGRPAGGRSPYEAGRFGTHPDGRSPYENSLFIDRSSASTPSAEVLADPAPTRRSRRSR